VSGVTSPPYLACRGGSNGGLLVGNALVQRPDLFGAVVCQVPLLDMKRCFLLFFLFLSPDLCGDILCVKYMLDMKRFFFAHTF
jgi:prolyl oligopeptidase PreP (S9A serine peptidase family)